MVSITFKDSAGQVLTETNALDFGTVQAGSSSGIKIITVTNTGDSDAQNCVLEAKPAKITNGFALDYQAGTDQDTWQAQTFANDATSGSWYSYALFGIGKNYSNKTGGTLQNTSGTDTCATKWNPLTNAQSGPKVWGNIFSCNYIAS